MTSKKGRKTGPKTEKKPETTPEIGQNGIEPPAFLSTAARVFWFQYRDVLIKARMLTDADVAAFAMFCDQCALVEKAETEIEKHGLLIDDARGSKKPNPAIGIKNRALSHVLNYAKQLGLTPKARKVDARTIQPPAGGGGVNEPGGAGANQTLSTENRRSRLFQVAN
jgi:P27 family predicted phage terminase small subunit